MNKSYKAGVIYTYALKPKNYQPLSKVSLFKNRKFFALFSDFNFYLLPDKFSVTANLDREYSEFQIRNTIPGVADLPPLPVSVGKQFNIIRTYTLSFPITKSIKLEYNATNGSRVMEPQGLPIRTQDQRDSVRQAFFNKQVNTDFKQTISLNYEVPINKIPFLDFVTLTAHYTGSYDWIHAPFAADTLGATIQNSSTRQLNGQINFVTFYNKIPWLKKMLQGDKGKQPPPLPKGVPGKTPPGKKQPATNSAGYRQGKERNILRRADFCALDHRS